MIIQAGSDDGSVGGSGGVGSASGSDSVDSGFAMCKKGHLSQVPGQVP